MTPGSPSTPRRRTKRVSAQHTQERVRNNQRRHRARRKDHIATLEQKLDEAKQAVSTLRDQVESLQAALARCRSQTHDEADCRTRQLQRSQRQHGPSPPPFTDTDGEAAQACGGLPDTEDLGTWELPTLASDEPLVSHDQPGSEISAFIPPPHQISQALTPRAQAPLVAESASNRAITEVGSLPPAANIQNLILTATTPCCSNDLSSDSQPIVNTTNQLALISSQETPVLMPGYVLQPAMETYYQAWPYGESTMSCSEAYILIAQQNFKGMNQGEVATWLWNGFRTSLQPGEGCRVQTDILFSLLAFISDTSSEVPMNVTPQH